MIKGRNSHYLEKKMTFDFTFDAATGRVTITEDSTTIPDNLLGEEEKSGV